MEKIKERVSKSVELRDGIIVRYEKIVANSEEILSANNYFLANDYEISREISKGKNASREKLNRLEGSREMWRSKLRVISLESEEILSQVLAMKEELRKTEEMERKMKIEMKEMGRKMNEVGRKTEEITKWGR